MRPIEVLHVLLAYALLPSVYSNVPSSHVSADAKRLVHDLFSNGRYDVRVRPVIKDNTTTNVTIRMNLYMITDINEHSQTVRLYMWTVQIWQDEFLRWNPADYGGIDLVIVPYNMVWLPDTYLYNGIEMDLSKTERRISVILTMTNKNSTILYLDKASNDTTSAVVTFRYPAIYKFTCYMNILYYPFDRQFCRMSFGSWMFDATQIDYFPYAPSVFMEQYTEHTEWSIISFETKRVIKDYQCCVNPFSLLYADLILARKPWFSLVNLIIPTAIISFVSLFGIFSPTSSGGERTEKINLGITTLLTMSILLLMVSQEMPTTSDFIPLIGWFYLSVIILISCATLLSIAVIELQRQSRYGRQIPPFWRKVVFGMLARRIFLHITVKEQKAWMRERPYEKSRCDGSIYRTEQNISFNCVPEGSLHLDHRTSLYRRLIAKRTKLEILMNENGEYQDNTMLKDGEHCELLTEIMENIHEIIFHIKQKEWQKHLDEEWDRFATIVERLLMIIFISLSLFVTLGIVFYGMTKGASVILTEDYLT